MSGYIVLSSSGEKLVKIKEKGECSKIIYKLVSKAFALLGAASETEAGKETGHKVHRPVMVRSHSSSVISQGIAQLGNPLHIHQPS